MELGYYIDEIRNSVGRDWKNLDTRLIVKFINTQRALHLRNKFNEPRLTYDKVRQTIRVDVCEDIENIYTDRFMYVTGSIAGETVTKTNIPYTIRRHDKDTIIVVRTFSPVISQPYNFITRDDALYAGNGRTNRNDIFCFLYDNAMYVQTRQENNPLWETIEIEGVFEDPVEVYRDFVFSGYNFDERCVPYPIDDTTWGYIKDNVIKYGIGSVQGTMDDKTNEVTEKK